MKVSIRLLENDFKTIVDKYWSELTLIEHQINQTMKLNLEIQSQMKVYRLFNKIQIIKRSINDKLVIEFLNEDNFHKQLSYELKMQHLNGFSHQDDFFENKKILYYFSNNNEEQQIQELTKLINQLKQELDLHSFLSPVPNLLKVMNLKMDKDNSQYVYFINTQELIKNFIITPDSTTSTMTPLEIPQLNVDEMTKLSSLDKHNAINNHKKNDECFSNQQENNIINKEPSIKNNNHINQKEINNNFNENLAESKEDDIVLDKIQKIIILSKDFTKQDKKYIRKKRPIQFKALTINDLKSIMISIANSEITTNLFQENNIIKLYIISPRYEKEIESLLHHYSIKTFFTSSFFREIVDESKFTNIQNGDYYLIAIIIRNHKDKFSLVIERSILYSIKKEQFNKKWEHRLIKEKNAKNGIENIGNSCYMNCILQCLLHTHHLTMYFLLDCYKIDQTYDYKKHKIVFEYIKLVYGKLSNQNLNPQMFKTEFAKIYQDFNDRKQHDAFEFVSNLLNIIHDSLLRSNQKSNILLSNHLSERNPSIEQLYLESQTKLAQYNSKNDSIINDLFYGQFVTTIDCSKCLKIIRKYEAFTFLHLSLPQISYKIDIVFYYFESNKLIHEKITIPIFEKTTLKSIQYKIHYNHPNIEIGKIKYLFIEGTIESLLKILDWNNEIQIVFYEERNNYIYCLPGKNLPYSDAFCLEYNKDLFSNKVIKDVIINDENQLLKAYEKNDLEFKLLHSNHKQCALCRQITKECDLQNIQQTLDFLQKILQVLIFEISLKNNKKQVKFNNLEKKELFSLEDCLDYYTDCDELPQYNCKSCNVKVFNIKQTKISIPPKYFIIQLKRFKQLPNSNIIFKNKEIIFFPIENFDISKYFVDESIHGLYDLYGVVNHFGSLENGHYNAVCKNNDDSWNSYDDNDVLEINSNNIVTRDAYLLFYKMKDTKYPI